MRPSRTLRIPFTLLILAAGAAVPLHAGELRGRLVFPDGTPARGVSVAAVPYETPREAALREVHRDPPPTPIASASSGADGRFTLAVTRKDARYVVQLSGGAAVPAALEGVWEESETEELADAVVSKAEPLSGKVVDGAGAPVAGAEVTLVPGSPAQGTGLDPLPRTVRTGADGSFRFDAAFASGNAVSVEKEGLAPARLAGLASGALRRPIVPGEGVALAGTVLRSDRKGPAKGVLVRWDGAAATRWTETDENGRFSFAHAPPGKGVLTADGGEAGVATVAHLVLPLAADKPLVVTLAPAAALEGRIVDAKSSRAVPRAKLVAKAVDGVHVTRSGPDGRYRIGPLPAGRFHLRVDEPRYVLWEKNSLALRPTETKPLDVALVPGASISGRVTDEKGVPVADARGSLEKSGQTGLAVMIRRARGGAAGASGFRTGPDGSFRASRLAPGDGQKLTVSHPEFESASVAGLSLPPGGTKAGITVVLRRGIAITGLVHDKDGAPVAGAEISLRQDFGMRGGRRGAVAMVNIAGGPDRPAATSGPDGRFAIPGVSRGEWAVVVAKRGWGTERVAPVKVGEEHDTQPLDVTLAPGAAIAGTVRSKGGQPLEGYTVLVRTAGAPMGAGGSPGEPTGPDGSFFADGLKAGQSYDLTVISGAGLGPSKSVVAPSDGVELVVSGNGRIAGRALDEKSGRPLTDFTVSAEPDMAGGRMIRVAARAVGRRARSLSPSDAVHAEDGAFVLEDVPAGAWSVVVEAKGYQTARVSGVTVEEGATRENVEVRASPGGALTGRVLDARTGRGVPEVSVSAEPASGGGPMAILVALDDGSGVTTDADGRFTVEGLAPGRYKVTARHPDYAEGSESAEVKETGGTAEIRLAAGNVLGGVVVNAARQPVAGAEVSLNEQGEGGFGRAFAGGQTTTTDGGGRFRFDHLTAGRFQLSAALSGRNAPPLDVVVAPGDAREDLLLAIGAGITIHGVVTGLPDDQRSGVAVSGSGPDGWGASSRTGADGTFELTGAPAGAILLRAQAGDFLGGMKSASKQVVASDDQPVLEAEIAFEQGFTISGRVTKSGQPLAGATVSANLQGGGGRSASGRSDDGGVYRLDGLQPGRYSVTAFANSPGATVKSQTVDLAADQTLDIDFPIARIAGAVVESGTKRPLADANVTATAADATGGPGGIRMGITTDSNGRFALEGLDTKSYTVTVQKADYLFEKRDVAAQEQGSDDLVIELTRGQGIGIQVKDGLSGIALRSVFVRVSDTAKHPVFSDTVSLDGDGNGEVPSLPPGVYALWLDADGYAPRTVDSVSVPSSAVPVVMTPGGTVVVNAGPKTLASGSARLQFLTAAGTPYQLGPFAGEGMVTVSLPIRRFEHFAPGNYTVQAGTAGQAFSVSEGQTTVVTLP